MCLGRVASIVSMISKNLACRSADSPRVCGTSACPSAVTKVRWRPDRRRGGAVVSMVR